MLALGDVSYDLFCNAGKLLDERLEAMGATRLAERVDVDGMYEKPAAAWTTDVVKLLAAECADSGTAVTVRDALPPERIEQSTRERHQPVDARLVVNRLLTSPESDKEVRHYEIDLALPESFITQAIPSRCTHPTTPLSSTRS